MSKRLTHFKNVSFFFYRKEIFVNPNMNNDKYHLFDILYFLYNVTKKVIQMKLQICLKFILRLK